MKLIGIRVARVSALRAVPGFLPAAIRTALVFLVVPAVLLDRDGEGLHDKAAGTIVLRGPRASRASCTDQGRWLSACDDTR
jgi:uncharacterized RDD family membrane protein YckC